MAKATKKQIDAAKAAFAQHPKVDTLFVNPHGHCFTEKGWAMSSVDKASQLVEITRSEAMGEQPIETEETEEDQMED